jgi:hypothetical protein
LTVIDVQLLRIDSPPGSRKCGHPRPVRGQFLLYFYLFIFVVLGLELRVFTLSHSTIPIFVRVFFEIGPLGTVCLGWLRTVILLISAS